MCADLTQDEVLRYSRHLMLPEVGLEGQKKLKEASVLVVGTGGLGSPILLYLAAAGVGHIGLVDYDAVEESNLQRQVIHGTSQLGQPKVFSAQKRMLDLNPNIHVEPYLEVLDSANAEKIMQPYDILVDGTDNFPTRYLMNDYTVLHHKCYVYGSIFRFEGQVSVFDPDHGPCYRCLFPEPPPPGMVPTCSEGGVLGVLPGTIGTMQATETIKFILGIGEPLVGKLLMYDALDFSIHMVQLKKNPQCKVCGKDAEITHLIDYDEFCGISALEHHVAIDPEWEVDPLEVSRQMQEGAPVFLLDIREPVEHQVSSLPGQISIPYGQLAGRLGEIPGTGLIVAFCRTGTRSARAVQILRGAGFTSSYSMRGGINAWARQVDPALLQY